MRELIYTSQFRRELRRARRRGKDTSKLDAIVAQLRAGEPLDPRQRRHQLTGNWHPAWECHIEPDWLLVWLEDDAAITLMRTGTHSDIFTG